MWSEVASRYQQLWRASRGQDRTIAFEACRECQRNALDTSLMSTGPDSAATQEAVRTLAAAIR